MNQVNEEVKAGIQLVSTYQGAMTYLKGLVWQRFEFWLARMADLNMTTVEKIKLIAEQYLGVNLTVEQCGNVQSIMGLQSVVTSHHDANIINEFQLAFNKDPVGMATTIKTFMTSARHNITMEIVHAYKKKIDTGNFEEKAEGYMAFGFDKKRAEDLAAMSGIPVDLYSAAGVNPDTWELY